MSDAAAAHRDLTAGSLRTLVETQLTTAGLTILSAGAFPVGDPHLVLSVDVSTASANMVACAVQVEFVQIVFMRRDPSVTFNRATTWGAEARVLLAAAEQLGAAVQQEAGRQVAQFVADYRVVNR